jgi:hypothetical protein
VYLLLQAIRRLPEADQDAVLALLLQGLSADETWQREVAFSDNRRRNTVALYGTTGFEVGGRAPAGAAAALQARVVPVRLPTELHGQLKAWCEEHGYSMAAVVRGLLQRFLESERRP